MPTFEPDPARELEVARKYCHGRGETQAMRDLAKIARDRRIPGPVSLDDDRSFPWEGIEEAADGWNYAVWGEQAGQISSDRASRICGHLAEAYRLLAGAEEDYSRRVGRLPRRSA